jgi:hypothetical protein
MKRCIVFHWHGEAPTQDAGDAFAEEATYALVDLAEKHRCLVGGGFQVVADPCQECALLAECPYGDECTNCHPQSNSLGVIVHTKRVG